MEQLTLQSSANQTINIAAQTVFLKIYLRASDIIELDYHQFHG